MRVRYSTVSLRMMPKWPCLHCGRRPQNLNPHYRKEIMKTNDVPEPSSMLMMLFDNMMEKLQALADQVKKESGLTIKVPTTPEEKSAVLAPFINGVGIAANAIQAGAQFPGGMKLICETLLADCEAAISGQRSVSVPCNDPNCPGCKAKRAKGKPNTTMPRPILAADVPSYQWLNGHNGRPR